MNPFDAKKYRLLGGLICDVYKTQESLLDKESRDHIEYYLSHDEYEIALESLSLSLLSIKHEISPIVFLNIKELLLEIQLDDMANRVLSETLFEDIVKACDNTSNT